MTKTKQVINMAIRRKIAIKSSLFLLLVYKSWRSGEVILVSTASSRNRHMTMTRKHNLRNVVFNWVEVCVAAFYTVNRTGDSSTYCTSECNAESYQSINKWVPIYTT